jgi:hypothetical protein
VVEVVLEHWSDLHQQQLFIWPQVLMRLMLALVGQASHLHTQVMAWHHT